MTGRYFRPEFKPRTMTWCGQYDKPWFRYIFYQVLFVNKALIENKQMKKTKRQMNAMYNKYLSRPQNTLRNESFWTAQLVLHCLWFEPTAFIQRQQPTMSHVWSETVKSHVFTKGRNARQQNCAVALHRRCVHTYSDAMRSNRTVTYRYHSERDLVHSPFSEHFRTSCFQSRASVASASDWLCKEQALSLSID